MNKDIIVARVVRELRNQRRNQSIVFLSTSIMCKLDQLKYNFNLDDSIYELYDAIEHEYKRRQLHRCIVAANRLEMPNNLAGRLQNELDNLT